MSKQFWEDGKWVNENFSSLVDKYPDQWVAVVDKQVISYGKELGKVRKDAKRKTGKDEIYLTYAECGMHVY